MTAPARLFGGRKITSFDRDVKTGIMAEPIQLWANAVALKKTARSTNFT
jgi:hypothetical protein